MLLLESPANEITPLKSWVLLGFLLICVIFTRFPWPGALCAFVGAEAGRQSEV